MIIIIIITIIIIIIIIIIIYVKGDAGVAFGRTNSGFW